MPTLYADLHPDTLYRCETHELIQLAVELLSSLCDHDSFISTPLPKTQIEMIEAVKCLPPTESIHLCEQVCGIIYQRLNRSLNGMQKFSLSGSLPPDAA
jgi:hypothetical protein